MSHAELYTEHRPTMLAAAYRITGSVIDAEDAVQDVWVPWSQVQLDTVAAPRAYLATMATRRALNTLRTKKRRQEDYIGPWLPEPVTHHAGPEWSVLHREGLGLALDFVLASLTSEQATAYVLRKVLLVDYDTIADVLAVSTPAARQLVSRAQKSISQSLGPHLPDQVQRDQAALERLVHAVTTGEVETVAALLAPTSALYSDGGGTVHAARHPVSGPDKIARFLVGVTRAPVGSIRLESGLINGSPGLLIFEDEVLTTVLALHATGDGIGQILLVRNPDKLRHA